MFSEHKKNFDFLNDFINIGTFLAGYYFQIITALLNIVVTFVLRLALFESDIIYFFFAGFAGRGKIDIKKDESGKRKNKTFYYSSRDFSHSYLKVFKKID